MDANQIEKLRALALAATPGPWHWWTSNSTLRLTGADGKDGGVLYGYVHSGVGDISCGEPNRAFIEASNPAAVLELIAEVERLTCELQNQREITQHWKASAGYVAAPAAGTVEKDAILEQAAAIADAERAEFMEQSCKNNVRESDFAFGSVNSAERIAASIRAIKSDAIAAHTKAGKDNA